MNWLADLCWAVELTIMYDRHCKRRGYSFTNPRDEAYEKRMWVCMCMRLGESAALRIDARPGEGRIISGSDRHYQIVTNWKEG